ncbi:MAG: hypothetical protein EAY75_07955 [Bacteroidetes bacterium]|nr:MAG: hypothetical protein EAY75_07955 [Bacteroidota bacterium]
MTELINKLVAEVGLNNDQASKALDVIKSFVKEKFPMLSGAVDNVFGTQVDDVAGAVAAEAAIPYADVVADAPKSWLDKISDIVPGEMGEQLEGFAKKAAVAAGEGFEKAKVVAEDLLEKGKTKLDELEKKVG